MTGLEIALIVLGTLFVVISFFIVGEKAEKDSEKAVTAELSARELTDEEKEQIRKNIASILEEEQSNVLRSADADLDKLSNEKIIAVTEFSDQVIEKIDSNHKEVVFLYDMLQKKEEELKEACQAIETSKREYSELYDRMTLLAEEENKRLANLPKKRGTVELVDLEEVSKSQETAKRENEATAKEDVESKPKAVRKPAQKKTVKKDVPSKPDIDISSLEPEPIEDQETMSRNEKILALHKKKKSVVEISKLLGIGQGEVKLVIGLYADK